MRVLIVDQGDFLEMARKLHEEGNEVFYYVPWNRGAPHLYDWIIGHGFGFQKVADFIDVIDSVDTVMLPDVGFGRLADALRREGKAVFGSSSKGDALELNRTYAKKVFEQAGIKYPTTHAVRGIESVIEHMKKAKVPHYMKVSTFRGSLETRRLRDAEDAREVMYSIASEYGPALGEAEFILEEEIDGVQIGVDTFFTGGRFARPQMFGFERDSDAVEKWEDETVFEGVLERLTPFLAEAGYSGAISIEGIYDGEDIYVVDVCARFPIPLGYVYTDLFEDFGEFVYDVARGKAPSIRPSHPYVGILNLVAPDGNKWICIRVKPSSHVKLARAMRKDSQHVYWCPYKPGFANIASVTAEGDSPEDVVIKLKENSKLVDSTQAAFSSSGVEQILEDIDVYEHVAKRRF